MIKCLKKYAQRIWAPIRRHPARSFAIALLAVTFLLAWRGYLSTRGPLQWLGVVEEFYSNFTTELFSIAVTVLIVDWLNERRQTQQLKEQLIRDMGGQVNDFALRAVRELRTYGWLEDGSLQGAYLLGANLQNANLQKASLQEALLTVANLQDAWLVKANLQDATMKEANLQGARLPVANLQRADLTRANFQDADLRFADFRCSILTGANFQDAKYYRTTWPDSFDPIASGAISVKDPVVDYMPDGKSE